jgi:RHS repeat-associated protein
LRDSRTQGSTTTFTWDVNGSIPQVVDDGTLKYVYGLGRIAQVENDDDTFYYLTDGLGSTMALTDASGSVVNTYEYDVFGAVRSSTGSQPNEFKFTGEQVDASTGLEYLRARYYDMGTGRFVSTDPFPGILGLPLSQNAYSYALNNAALLIDPMGLFGIKIELPNPVDTLKSCGNTLIDTTKDIANAAADVVEDAAAFASRFATLNCLDAALNLAALASPPAFAALNGGRLALGLASAAVNRTSLAASLAINGRQWKKEGGLVNAAGMGLGGAGFAAGLLQDVSIVAKAASASKYAGTAAKGLGVAGLGLSAYQCYEDVTR